jgi:hypothetical protein
MKGRRKYRAISEEEGKEKEVQNQGRGLYRGAIRGTEGRLQGSNWRFRRD